MQVQNYKKASAVIEHTPFRVSQHISPPLDTQIGLNPAATIRLRNPSQERPRPIYPVHISHGDFRASRVLRKLRLPMSLIPPHYVCKICHKGFLKASVLRDHQNVHSGLRPYSCKHCGRAFANHGSRYQHEQTHQKRRHKCACGKLFGRSQELERHQGLGRVECAITRTNTSTLSVEIDQVNLVVSQKARHIASQNTAFTHGIRDYFRNSIGNSRSLSYGNFQSDLLMRNEATFDCMIVTLRAFVMITAYQLRFVMGDITRASFQRQIRASLDTAHRMIDQLAGSATTLLPAWICASFFCILCKAGCGSARGEFILVTKMQEFQLRFDNLGAQLSCKKSWRCGIGSMKQRMRLCNHSPELLHMASLVRSNLGDTIKSLPPTTDWRLLYGIRGGLGILRNFVYMWIAFTASRQASITQSWDAIEIFEDQIEEIVKLYLQHLDAVIARLESSVR